MSKKLGRFGPAILLIVVGIIGILRVPTVGISWDEPGQRESAGLSIIHVAQMVSPGLIPANYSQFNSAAADLAKNGAFDHGVAFDAPVLVAESILGIHSTRDIYIFHHLMVWFTFLVGLSAMYLIVNLIYGRKFLALFAASLLLLSPRIFAEGFYNTKDIPFMSFLLLSAYFIVKAMRSENRIKYLVVAGVVTGFATDIRILGLVELPIASGILIILALRNRIPARRITKDISTYLAVSLLTVYSLFPYLWGNPIRNLVHVVQSMSNYPWTGYMLFDGRRIQAQHLPWYYLPKWISVTTPIVYLLLMIVGLYAYLIRYFFSLKKLQYELSDIEDVYLLSMAILPLSIIIILHSTVYDSWRHVFFIYPYLLLLAIKGFVFLESLLNSYKYLLVFVVMIALSNVLIWMGTNNPMQNLYFNQIARGDIQNQWEVDYWGLSNESALRWVLSHDSRSRISIQEVSFTPLSVSAKMLSDQERSRLVFDTNTMPNSDYLINNFRSGTIAPIKENWPGYAKFKTFSTGNVTYLEILKKVD
jgi:hypothetical protein